MRELLHSELGFLGTSQVCKEILAGIHIVPEEVDIYTKDLLYTLVKPTNLMDTPKAVVAIEEFV